MTDNYQQRADIARQWGEPSPREQYEARREYDRQCEAIKQAASAAVGESVCINGAGLVVGRAQGLAVAECVNPHAHTVSATPFFPQAVMPAPIPQVSIGPAGDINLPAGEAFARSTVLALINEAVRIAVQRDRQRNPAQGWSTREGAKRALIDILNDVLTAQHVPEDHAVAIIAACVNALHVWAND